jgi:hypothetical protein
VTGLAAEERLRSIPDQQRRIDGAHDSDAVQIFTRIPNIPTIIIAMQGQVVSIWTVSHRACEVFLHHILLV